MRRNEKRMLKMKNTNFEDHCPLTGKPGGMAFKNGKSIWRKKGVAESADTQIKILEETMELMGESREVMKKENELEDKKVTSEPIN